MCHTPTEQILVEPVRKKTSSFNRMKTIAIEFVPLVVLCCTRRAIHRTSCSFNYWTPRKFISKLLIIALFILQFLIHVFDNVPDCMFNIQQSWLGSSFLPSQSLVEMPSQTILFYEWVTKRIKSLLSQQVESFIVTSSCSHCKVLLHDQDAEPRMAPNEAWNSSPRIFLFVFGSVRANKRTFLRSSALTLPKTNYRHSQEQQGMPLQHFSVGVQALRSKNERTEIFSTTSAVQYYKMKIRSNPTKKKNNNKKG